MRSINCIAWKIGWVARWMTSTASSWCLAHCGGGPQAWETDYVTPPVKWREQGQAPEGIVGTQTGKNPTLTHLAPSDVGVPGVPADTIAGATGTHRAGPGRRSGHSRAGSVQASWHVDGSSHFGGMSASELKRRREIEAENAKLKRCMRTLPWKRTTAAGDRRLYRRSAVHPS